MANFFQPTAINDVKPFEPYQFEVLRDLMARRLIDMQMSPWGGQMPNFSLAGRGGGRRFDPYSGGYYGQAMPSEGWTPPWGQETESPGQLPAPGPGPGFGRGRGGPRGSAMFRPGRPYTGDTSPTGYDGRRMPIHPLAAMMMMRRMGRGRRPQYDGMRRPWWDSGFRGPLPPGPPGGRKVMP